MKSKLEMVLDAVSVTEEESKPILERPIDYRAIREIALSQGSMQAAARLSHVFQDRNIKTYGDLLAQYQRYTDERLRDSSRAAADFGTYLCFFKNLGKKSVGIFIDHLLLIGMEIPQ